MANERIEINLGFNADVTNAKKNIQDLQNSLNQISNLKTNPGDTINNGLQEAAKSADILSQHLNAAMNVKTGNLDLNKFQMSLKESGQDVSKLAGNLLNAGITGEQAFAQLQNSVAMANIKFTESNTLLNKFATTLANTAKWQISSTILHGFMGAIQGAYGYAQDLNESLNKIRIVTGQSVDQMDKFAEKANKAAQSLSASTLAYTDAALIFYQQGLDDKSVEERTNVTVKMMNVTGQSAQEVSSQMTAIWNNFDNGSESMEHYADVITNLGAKTAASSSEIAEGLQKFSAVANTVGLSYEYATSALATVVAQTRQSADTVGTAFKTLFARIQDLELGKILDDGTSLGKYAQALKTVGVDIKDVNGEVKDMDQILNDLGGKWNSLSKDVQEATAQTVAGTRQYANFLALMDNWDSFQSNLSIAQSSDGTLEEQAQIYEESWEASKKRVQASLQDLYNNLIDDKFFIKLNDSLAKIINGVTDLFKGLGGVKGILLLVSNIVLSKLGPSLTNTINLGIENLGYVQKSLTGIKDKAVIVKDAFTSIFSKDGNRFDGLINISDNFKKINNEVSLTKKTQQDLLDRMIKTGQEAENVTEAFRMQQEGLGKINDLSKEIKINKHKLTEKEREYLQEQSKGLIELNNQRAALKDQEEILQAEVRLLKEKATYYAKSENKNYNSKDSLNTKDIVNKNVKPHETENLNSSIKLGSFDESIKNAEQLKEKFKELSIPFEELNVKIHNSAGSFSLYSENSDKLKESIGTIVDKIVDINSGYRSIIDQVNKVKDGSENWQKKIDNILEHSQDLPTPFKTLFESVKNSEDGLQKFKEGVSLLNNDALALAEKFGISVTEIEGLDNVISSLSLKGEFEDIEQVKNQFNEIGINLESIKANIIETDEGFKIWSTDSTNIDGITGDIVASISDLHQGFAQTEEYIMNISDTSQDWENQVDQILKNSRDLPKPFKDVLTNIKQNCTSADQFKGKFKQMLNPLGKIAKAAGIPSKKFTEAAQSGTKLGLSIKQADAAEMQFNKKISDTTTLFEKLKEKSSGIGQNVTQAVQGFSSVAMGLNAVKNAIDTLKDEDASVFQKMTASAMGLSMGLQAISGASNLLKASYDLLIVKTGLLNTVTTIASTVSFASAAAKRLEASGDKEATAAAIAKLAAKKGLIATEKIGLVTEAINQAMQEKGRVLNASEIASIFMKTGAKGGETAARLANVVAIIAEETAMSPLLVITLLLVAAMAALVAVIAIVVSVVGAVTDAYNADANAAKNAEEAAKNLKESYNETKQAYEDLKATVSDYKDAVKGIKEMQKGTQEWRDAIISANEKAMELINNYDGLKYTVGEGGLIEIDEDSLRELQEQEQQKVIKAQNTSMMADVKAKEARAKADRTELRRSNDLSFLDQVGLLSTGPIGWGAAIGLGVNNAIQDKKTEDAIDRLTTGDLAKQFQNGELSDDFLKEELNINDDELIASIKELASEMNANTAAEKAAAQAATESIVANDEKVQNSDHAEDVSAFAAETYQEEYNSAYEEELAKAKSRGLFNTGNAESKEAMNKYAKLSGLSDQKGFKVTNYKGDGTVEYEYLDENGDKQTKTVTAEEIAATNAADTADAKTKENAEKVAELLDSGKVNDETIATLKALQSGDTSSLTLNDMKNMDVSNLSEEDMKNLNLMDNLDLSWQERIEMWTMSQEERNKFLQEKLQESLDEQAEETKKTIIDYGANYGDAVGAAMTDIVNGSSEVFNNLSQDQLTAYADSMGSILQSGGQEAVDAFNSGMQGILEANADQAGSIMDIANNIDWTQGEKALDEFNASLREQGIYLDENSEEYQELVKSMGMINIKISPPDYQAARKQLQDLRKLAKDIKTGGIISDDDYAKLIEADKTLANMFVQTADGYAYTGAEDLTDVINKANQDDIRKNLDNSIQAARVSGQMDESFNNAWSDGEKRSAKFLSDRENWDDLDMGSSIQAKLSYDPQLAETLGMDKDELLRIAEKDQDDWTEKEKEYIEKFYSNIDTLQKDVANGMYDLDQGLIQLGNSYNTYGEGLAAIRDYAANNDIGDTDINNVISEYGKAALVSAKNLEELDTVRAEIFENGGSVDSTTYSAALKNIASQYDNCSEELEKYNLALQSGNETLIEAAENNLRLSIVVGEAAKKYDLNAEVLETQAKMIQGLNKDMDLSAEQAAKLAIANQRMNKGISTLNQNFKSWKKTLWTANVASEEYAEALTNVQNAIKDLLGASDDFQLPDGFIDMPGVMDLIEDASNGDEKAINKLGIQVSRLSISAMKANDAMEAAFEGTDYDFHKFNTYKTQVLTGIGDIQSSLTQLNDGTKSLDDVLSGGAASWVDSLNAMALATGMSVDEMNGLLNQLGVQADVEVKNVKQEMEVPTYTDYVETSQYEPAETDDKGNITKPAAWSQRKYTVPGEPITVEGYTQVAQISTGDDKKSPNIKYTGVGGSKKSSTTGVSMGGGANKSSKGATKEKKKRTDEIERYHTINKQLESSSKELERLSNAKDKAWGQGKIDAMQAEAAAMEREIGLQKQLAAETDAYLAMDKQALSAYGAVFDEFGNIVNYNEIMQQQLDKYNSELTEDAEKAYNKFKDVVSQYEETLDKNIDAHKAVQTAIDNLKESFLEQLDYVVTFKIESNENIINSIDRKIERLGDDAADTAEKIGLIGEKIGRLKQNYDSYMKGASDVILTQVALNTGDEEYAKAMAEKFASGQMSDEELMSLNLSESDLQKIQDYLQNAQDSADAMREAALESFDLLQQQFDLGAEKFDKQIEKIDKAKQTLDNYTKIADVLGKGILGLGDEFTLQTKKASAEIASSRVGVIKNSIEAYKENLKQANKDLQSALASGDAEQVKRAKEVIESIEDKIEEATDDLYSSASDAAQAFRDVYEEQVDQAIKAMEKTFTGGKSFDQFDEDFSYAREEEKRYLPIYQKMYELNKLSRDLNKSLNQTDSLAGKKALLEIQEKINKAQEEGNELTEYDLANLRREYELKLAQNQLEETQNAKDTVRMTKNAEGNWAYIYTASEDKVADAEQNYEDKLYNIQKANEDYINTLEDNIVQAQKDYLAKIREIRLDNSLSEEERNNLEQQAYDRFMERINFNKGQLQNVFSNNQQLQDIDLDFYSNYLKNKGELDNSYLNSYNQLALDFNGTTLGMQTGYTTLEGYQTAMEQAIDTSLKATNKAYDTYKTNTDDVLKKCGLSITGYKDTVDEKTKEIVKDTQNVETESEKLKKEVVSDFAIVSTEVGKLLSKFNTDFPQIITHVENLNTQIQGLIDKAANEIQYQVTVNYTETGDVGAIDIIKGDKSEDDDYVEKTNYDTSTKYRGKLFDGSWFESGDKYVVEQKIKASYARVKLIRYFESQGMNNATAQREADDAIKYELQVHLDQIEKLDTGGYTGEWGDSSGRLALLHEKELVLNKQDTENLLKSVEIIRSLSNSLNSQALMAQQLQLGNLQNNFNQYFKQEPQQLEQNVHITAEFPGVQDRNEIEEAFNTLINQASQYIHRYNY